MFSQISRETKLLHDDLDNHLYTEMSRQDDKHPVIMNALICGRFNETIYVLKKNINFWWEFVLVCQISLFQNFALL